MTSQQVQVKQQIRYLAQCPIDGCEEFSDITYVVEDVLRDGKTKVVGPWSCKNCGNGIEWTVVFSSDSDYKVTYKIAKECEIKRLVLLDLDIDGLEKPIQIVVHGMRFEPKYGLCKSQSEADEYFYNEHTCPTNYLQSIEIIIEGDNADPHGIFKFNKAIDLDDELKSKICEIGRNNSVLFEHNKDDWENVLCNMNAEQIRSLFDEKKPESEMNEGILTSE